MKPPREDSTGSFSKTLGDKVKPQPSTSAADAKLRGSMKEKDAKDGPPEVGPPANAKAAEAPPGMKRATGAREQAIREFMDSFESEFGIPPTRIVEAMASIEPQKMNESPEATVPDVIESLDLPAEDQEKAMAMYVGLLGNLQRIDAQPAKPQFVSSDAAVTLPQVRERFAIARDKRVAVNHAVDSLNQKFWMSGTDRAGMGRAPGEAAKVEVEHPADDAPMMFGALGGTLNGEEALASLPDADPSLPQDQAPVPPQGPPNASPSADRMKKMLTDMKRAADEARIEKTLAQAGLVQAPVAGAALQAPAAAPAGEQPFMVPVMAQMQQPMQDRSAQDFGSPQGGNGEGRDGQSDGFSKETGSHAKDGAMKSLAMASPALAVPLKMEDVAAALKAGPAPLPLPPMSPQDHEANIQQLMSQAQYLVKKGGGEMKVEMSPEGMGQLHLKVLVQDGKVNVQMAAENSETRKLIESSLPELRSSLAAHKLSMDHIKVDVVSAPSTDNQMRNDPNANPNSQQQRETRQFWNNFQENFGNRGQREGFWDMPGLSSYRQGKTPAALQPAPAAKSSGAKRSDGRGNGLDLVA